MKTAQCPSPQELSDFDLGETTIRRQAEISDHLDECDHCSAFLEQLDEKSDDVIGRLRDEFPDEIIKDDSELDLLVDRAAALCDTSTDAQTNTSEGRPGAKRQLDQVMAEMLRPAEGDGEIGRLGSYRILKVLGMGGMGVVFEAEDTELQRRVALKAMNTSSATSSDSARERFLREARATAAVHHDNIVTIYQVGEDHGVPYLAMQLLKGESLGVRMCRQGKLDVAEALRIAREAAQGLAAAHSKGLTHRDIKPDNIWLELRDDRFAGEPPALAEGGRETPRDNVVGNDRESTPDTSQGLHPGLAGLHPGLASRPGLAGSHAGLAKEHANGGRVKILDFGLARVVDEHSNLTQSGAIVGTPSYLSPEQAMDSAADARSDLFSLGVVLYEMLTARRPFERSNLLAILRAIGTDSPNPPCELDDAIPEDVSNLVMRLLEKDPEKRFPSASDLIADIEECEHRLANDSPQALDPERRAPGAEWRAPGVSRGRDGVSLGRDVDAVADAEDAPTPRAHALGSPELPESPECAGATSGRRAPSVSDRRAPSVSWGRYGGRRKVWIAATALGLIGLLLAAAVIYVKTDRGTIIVKAEGFEVTAESEVVTIRNKETGERYSVRINKEKSLPSGNYELVVENRDGLKFKAKEFTVRRGDLTLEVAVIAQKGDQKASPPMAHQVAGLSPPMSPLAMVQNPPTLTTSDGKVIDSHTLETVTTMGSTTAAVSPDGKHVATFSDDRMIRIWDPYSLQPVQMLVGHTAGPLRRVIFNYPCVAPEGLSWNPDNRRLAAISMSGELRVWDSLTGQQLYLVKLDATVVRDAVWSPNGKLLAVSFGDQVIRVYNELGNLVSENEHLGGVPTPLAWSPDSTTLATAVRNEPFIYLWDVQTGKARRLKCPARVLSADYLRNSLAWSPDGTQIAACCDKLVAVCDVETEEVTTALEEAASAVAWTPDGSELLAGLLIGERPRVVLQVVRIARSGKLQRVDFLNTTGMHPLTSMKPLSEGNRVFTGLFGGAHILNLDTGEVKRFEYSFKLTDVNTDGSTIARWYARSGGQNGVELLTDAIENDQAQWRSIPASFHPKCAVCSHALIGVESGDNFYGKVAVFDRQSGRRTEFFAINGGGNPADIDISPDDRFVLLARTRQCSILSRATNQEVAQFTSMLDESTLNEVRAARYSPDGSEIAVVGTAIAIHDARDGKLKRSWKFDGDTQSGGDVAWSPNGNLLAVATRSFEVHVYDAVSGDRRATLRGFPERGNYCGRLAWSPDGKYLTASGYWKDGKRWKQLFVWDVAEGKIVLDRPLFPSTVRFEDDTTLVYATDDGHVVYENAATGKQLRMLEVGIGSELATFTPNGKQLLEVIGDRTFVRNLDDGSLQATILSISQDGWAVISPDGHYLGSPDVPQYLRDVIRTKNGTRVLRPFEFCNEFDWRNDPNKVQLK